MVERRIQKTVCKGRGVDAPVCQKGCNNRTAPEMGAEPIDHIGLWLIRLNDIPFFHMSGI